MKNLRSPFDTLLRANGRELKIADNYPFMLSSLDGKMVGLESEIKRLNNKVDALRNELKAEISRVDEKIASQASRLEDRITHLDDKLTFTNKRLDEALEIRERLETLERLVKDTQTARNGPLQ